MRINSQKICEKIFIDKILNESENMLIFRKILKILILNVIFKYLSSF